jgi:dTDP-4-dehydrorhamnose 3,5-epimerase
MTTHFDISEVAIEGLKLIQRRPMGDNRGYLERLFCADELASLTRNKGIMQINHTLTAKRGTLRGMHFQHPPHAEMKFVSCLRGEVFDVAVDLRQGSATLLHWHGEILSAGNHKTMVIPEGFAHGFQTLTKNCEMLYLHFTSYQPASEDGLNAQDPRLGIRWPEAVSGLSLRDRSHPMLTCEFRGISL